MEHVTVRFLPEDIQVQVQPGSTVLEAAQLAGLRIDAPCGGKGACKKCKVVIDGQEVLACQTKAARDLTVTLQKAERSEILTTGVRAAVQPDGAHDYVLAFDIGTTTVVGYLLSGQTGAQLATAGMLNPQGVFGADVISRIQYVMNGTSEELQMPIVGGLQSLTRQVAEKAGIDPAEIALACVVGNTAMHHLFLGIDPRPLTTPPYMPSVKDAQELPAKGILPIREDGVLRILPNIAGFVGADTVGCLVATDFDRLEKLTLMIDIGTNGEMVMGNKTRRIACSTAAGPAFEGAKIQCGMRGAEGAIDHVRLEDGKLVCHVIGGGKAVGLCGSGLLDAVAALLAAGMVRPSGRMVEFDRRVDGIPAVTLHDDVFLTQKDVREVQLAKSAIRSGIELLAKQLGHTPQDVETVYLAGAFGNYLSPASACAIGMIPPCMEPHIVSVGNAAGAGSCACAVSRTEFEHSKCLAAETEFLELASLPEFQDCYVDYLNFSEDDDD